MGPNDGFPLGIGMSIFHVKLLEMGVRTVESLSGARADTGARERGAGRSNASADKEATLNATVDRRNVMGTHAGQATRFCRTSAPSSRGMENRRRARAAPWSRLRVP